MTTNGLSFISSKLEEIGIEYELMEWTSNPVPEPYFVGEYSEVEPYTESGEQETTFILTGHSTTWISLERARQKIKKLFPINGLTAVFDDSSIAVFYSTSFQIPTENVEMKRLQINLTIKEWSVN